jgi:hypothetical protein
MRPKIHLLWQHAKIVRIQHFSEHSKVHPNFLTLNAFDRQCPSNCAALSGEHEDDQGNSSERAGTGKFSRRWVPYFLAPAQNFACVEASTEMLRALRAAKITILKELQQVTNPGSNIPLRPEKFLYDRQQMPFQ